MKKLFGFNLDVELKDRLNSAAKKKYTNSSILLNQILCSWLDEFEQIPEKEKVVVEKHIQTEEERLRDWEWRKSMVEQGKFPVHMAEEYPVVELPSSLRKDIYLTSDGKVLADDKSNARTQADIDFDESLKMSLAEKK